MIEAMIHVPNWETRGGGVKVEVEVEVVSWVV